jgi:penicillin-binding protein 2
MKRGALFLLLITLLVTACNQASDGLPGGEATVPTLPTRAPEPTLGPITEDAGGYARAFYRAWEGGDLLGMYSLLSPESQALVDSGAFIRRYQEAMDTATVRSIRAQPLSSLQEGPAAEMSWRVTWETALVGDIVRDHTMRLVYDDGRWGVDWDEGLILPELAGGNRLSMEYQIPTRGNIYDREGLALAYQGNAFELGVIPGRITDEAGLLALLSQVFGRPTDKLRELYANAQPEWYVPLGTISEATLQQYILQLEPYFQAGLSQPQRQRARLYSDLGTAPHLIGYMGAIPVDQLADYKGAGYRGDERVGLAGLEAWGEEYLNGERGGRLSVVTPTGEVAAIIEETEPQAARSIYTTFDLDFQAAVESALAEAIQSHPLAEKGAIVVLNPNSGDVLAMATYPSYDPTVFDALQVDGGARLTSLLNDPSQPLINRAAQGVYPAGSTFKLVTMGAALNSGLYNFDSRYSSTGVWTRLGEEYAKTDWLTGGHGTVSLRTALIVSCNTCFYDVGYTVDGADNQLFPRIAQEFGFGRPTGIQGIAEASGLIPDPDWKLATIGDGWATGDAVNMAIGQGYVQVTPLQMAVLAGAIANGGTLYRPTLIDRIGAAGSAPEEPFPPQANGTLPVSAEDLAIYQDALWNVTHSGNGTATHRFQNFPISVSGKTGTAEAPPGPPHAWFVGYAPSEPYTMPDGTVIDTPQLAIAVIVENAGEGSEVGAPLFRRVVERYFGITPEAPFPWGG